jgi:hypothetical protein
MVDGRLTKLIDQPHLAPVIADGRLPIEETG